MIEEEPLKRPGVLQSLLLNARSYARPHVRATRGKGRVAVNLLHRALGTGRRIDEPLKEQWRRVLNRSQDVLASLPPPSGPKVLIASGSGFAEHTMAVEPIIGMALRMRGANPMWLAVDKVLPACDWNRFGNYHPPPGAFAPPYTSRSSLDRCRACVDALTESFGQMPFPGLSLQRYLHPDDYGRVADVVDGVAFEHYAAFHYRGIHVGEHAYASTMRAFQRGTLRDDPESRFLFRRYLAASILLTDLTERVFDDVQPDRVLAHHGIYVIHGTICEVARKRGIGVVVYGIPYRKGTIILSHDDTYHRTMVTEPNDQWENIDLSGERGEIIDRYLTSRRIGTKDNVTYNAHAIEDQDTLLRELDLDPALPVVSLYTNVIWDAQLFYNYTAFANMIEWLTETIRYFARRPDRQLVIRIHPAEVQGLMATTQPIEAEIRAVFPTLPRNVRVIPPTSRLSSYTLAEMSEAALIYGTKMGVEIASLGTPLIVAGETFNRGKGYSHDVETRESYFALLDRLGTLERHSTAMMERARKYAYHLFHRRMIELPLFAASNTFRMTGIRLTFDDLHALEPGRHPSLDLICEGIVDGVTPFVFDSLADEPVAADARR